MKLSPEVATPLVEAVVMRATASPTVENTLAYTYDELMLFMKDDSFFGLSFSAFGQNFAVAGDMEVYITLPKGDRLVNRRVEDAVLINLLEGFIRWRTAAVLALVPDPA